MKTAQETTGCLEHDAFKCKLGEQKTCSILNEKLGDCEICEDDFCSEYGYKVVWRCPNYVQCSAEIEKTAQDENSSTKTDGGRQGSVLIN